MVKRRACYALPGSAVLMGDERISGLGPGFVIYGWGRVKASITYEPAEVRGLARLREIMAQPDRFATNRDALDVESLAPPNIPCFSRDTCLAVNMRSQWFSTRLRDNDLLFSAKDAETMLHIARTWDVRRLVARPGTGLNSHAARVPAGYIE